MTRGGPVRVRKADMKRARSLSAILLMTAVVPAAIPPLRAQEPPRGEITADELYDLIAGELTKVLGSNQRFEPLPPALSDAAISPEHVPCFTFPPQRITDLMEHLHTERSYTLQHDRFRLLVDRRVVGDKIAFLKDDLRPEPPEEKLLAALEGLEHPRPAGLVGLLEELTLYPSDSLRDLSDRLVAMPRGTPEEVLSFFEGTLNVLQRMAENAASPEEESAVPGLGPLLERYARETRKAYNGFIAAAGPSPERFPNLLARCLTTGYQYYRGGWIRRPRVLLQTRLSDAVIELTYKPSIITPEGRGIFRIDGGGGLHLLLGGDDLDPASPVVSAAEDPDGRALLLLRGQGLLRIDGDRAAWLDRGGFMKKMDALIGCDAGGRIYLRQTGYDGRAPRQYLWAYRPEGEPEALRPAETFPLIRVQSFRTAEFWYTGPSGPFPDIVSSPPPAWRTSTSPA